MTVQRVCTPEEFLDAEPVRRLELVRKQIESEPEAWYQNRWISYSSKASAFWRERSICDVERASSFCGSAACLAGWTCLLAGDVVLTIGYAVRPRGSKREVHVRSRANELLGLEAGHELFNGENSLEDIDREIARLREMVY